MNQLNLPFQSHSSTSKAAARQAQPTAGSDEARVLDFLTERGERGATDEEIHRGTGVGLNSHRARRVSLCRKGLVVDSGLKRETTSGRLAVVWVRREQG